MTYIAQVLIDPSIEAKIKTKHNVTSDDVRSALEYPARVSAAWEEHPDHGRRLVASGTTRTGRPILAWLEPVDETDGTWRLRSARVGT